MRRKRKIKKRWRSMGEKYQHEAKMEKGVGRREEDKAEEEEDQAGRKPEEEKERGQECESGR